MFKWVMIGVILFLTPSLSSAQVIFGGRAGGGGSGSVTSITATGGLETTTGSAITTTGTIRSDMCVRAVTGTSDTILSTDRGCLVTYSNASSIAVTLPQAGTTGFDAGFWFQAVNLGAGTVTITPSTSTIQDSSDLILTTDKGVTIASNGTDYYHNPGLGLTAESQTLQDVFTLGKSITGANSLANALRIGDGTTPICIYTDSTLGPVIKPCTDSDTRTHIWENYTWGIRDKAGDADMFIVNPGAATKKAMWAFQSGYYPLKSGWIPAALIEVDGANCAAPTAATPVASGAKLKTILCLDNDSSRMHITFLIPDDYDGGTITLTSAVVQTAADTGVIEFQARAQCKGDTETLVAITSFGTEVVWTDTMTGSGAVNKATSGAITPSGTCAAGDLISFSIDIGATNTTTAMATAHILGFRPTYSSTSLSH